MNKQDIVDSVNQADCDKQLKSMVLSYVNLSYDIGFNDGIKAGARVQSQAFDMLMNRRKK